MLAGPAASQDQNGVSGADSSAVAPLKLAGGGTVRLEGDFGRLRGGARTIKLAEDGTMAGSGATTRINCDPRRIDVAGLERSTREVLQRERLRVSELVTSANQLILYTQAWGDYGRRQFYSYIAEVNPCTTNCSVTLSVFFVDAPYRDGVLFLNEAKFENDDVTAALVAAAQVEFDRCHR